MYIYVYSIYICWHLFFTQESELQMDEQQEEIAELQHQVKVWRRIVARKAGLICSI